MQSPNLLIKKKLPYDFRQLFFENGSVQHPADNPVINECRNLDLKMIGFSIFTKHVAAYQRFSSLIS